MDGCKRTYGNYASFRRHLKKKHSEILDSQLQQEFITVGEESDNYESMEGPSTWSNSNWD